MRAMRSFAISSRVFGEEVGIKFGTIGVHQLAPIVASTKDYCGEYNQLEKRVLKKCAKALQKKAT